MWMNAKCFSVVNNASLELPLVSVLHNPSVANVLKTATKTHSTGPYYFINVLGTLRAEKDMYPWLEMLRKTKGKGLLTSSDSFLTVALLSGRHVDIPPSLRDKTRQFGGGRRFVYELPTRRTKHSFRSYLPPSDSLSNSSPGSLAHDAHISCRTGKMRGESRSRPAGPTSTRGGELSQAGPGRWRALAAAPRVAVCVSVHTTKTNTHTQRNSNKYTYIYRDI